MVFKKFFAKILNKLNKKQKKEEAFDMNWDNYQQEETYSRWSNSNIENFFEDSSILTIDYEKQEKFIKTSEYIFFTSYEKFKKYLVEEVLINPSLKIYNETKHKRLNSIHS